MNRLKPDGPNLQSTACPYCGEEIDCASCIDIEGAKPGPGDVTICYYCGEPGKFNDQLQMARLEGAELIEVMADPVVQEAMLTIKARKAAADPDRQKAYSDQLYKMSNAVIVWRKQHPDLELSIQYNFQKEVGLIAALKDAIDKNFVSVNDHALQMFRELGWLDDKPGMPTVMMVRVVLEHCFGKEE